LSGIRQEIHSLTTRHILSIENALQNDMFGTELALMVDTSTPEEVLDIRESTLQTWLVYSRVQERRNAKV
jgi:hypothetical protein